MQKIKFHLGNLAPLLEKGIQKFNEEKIAERIWKKDHTVWNQNPTEISNRLGWLDCSRVTAESFDEIQSFVNEIKNEGFENVLLMGMGGSSLAPEVFSKTFGKEAGYLNLFVIDSTHPAAVLKNEKELDFNKTLFIVSTKSGGTVETISFMKYFYTKAVSKLGKKNASKHFAAITDPGSGLEEMARELNFRKIFINDPNIGGRYSALSLFGIVPAALIGVDLSKLFEETKKAEEDSKLNVIANQSNLVSQTGILIAELAKIGKDKLTFVYSNEISSFGSWVEQLIAESTGKLGKGILPVDGANLTEIKKFDEDRVFVVTHLVDDGSFKNKIDELTSAGFIVVEVLLDSIYDYGAQFFTWEFATAVSGWALSIQPFDQPDVESAKISARKVVKEFIENGELPKLEINLEEENIELTGNFKSDNIKEVFKEFFGRLNKVNTKGYIALQAYTDPYGIMNEKLFELAEMLEKKFKCAVTVGFGPRFLHSTGQLHKGDSGNGLFIQFLDYQNEDADIPDKAGEENSSISFGILVKAQALGDREALLNAGRNVLTFQFNTESEEAMNYLLSQL